MFGSSEISEKRQKQDEEVAGEGEGEHEEKGLDKELAVLKRWRRWRRWMKRWW